MLFQAMLANFLRLIYISIAYYSIVLIWVTTTGGKESYLFHETVPCLHLSSCMEPFCDVPFVLGDCVVKLLTLVHVPANCG